MKSMKRMHIIFTFLMSVIFGILFFLAGSLFVIPQTEYYHYKSVLSVIASVETVADQPGVSVDLQKKAEKLKHKIKKLTPAGSFLVINTTENAFALYRTNQMIRSGLCSTGSFVKLEADSTQSWLFETPKGVFSVKDKIINPVWRKPDWAFIEEGLPVPDTDDPRRFERGVLGDYALNLGNGYLIHGTLYQRLLGMPVTHGCVRLSDQDLNEIYHSMEVGSRVFIY